MAHVQDRWFDSAGIKTTRHGTGLRWKARYRGTDNRERSKTFAKKIDAERFIHSTEVQKLERRWVDPALGKKPLATFATEWMGSRLNIRGATRSRDEGLVRNHIVERLGKISIAELSKADVQAWVQALSAHYAPATVRKSYSLLGAIMAEAVDQRLIVESPCRRMSLPRMERTERRFLSADEVEVLVDAFPLEYRALIYTAVYLGCRWEELAGLKRSHLDVLRREVRIVGTIERVAGTYTYSEETKSDASRRTLRLPRFLVDVLALHLRAAPPSEWVFPAPGRGHLRYDNFRRRTWAPAVKRADLEPLTFHELRHTAAALLVDGGADPLQVQKRLGHKDIRTTLGLYGHLFPNREDDLNGTLERIFARARAEAVTAPPRPEGIPEVAEIREIGL